MGVSFAAPSFVPASAPAGAGLIEGARRSATLALAELRPEVPATARLLDRLISDAEAITADERTAPRWERYPGRAEEAWGRVLVTAHQALGELHGRRRTFEARWDGLYESVRADVRRAQREADEAGVGRREMSAAKQAALKLDLAERYARSGAHDRAIVAAEEAREFTKVVRDGFVALHARYGDPTVRRRWRGLAEETIALSRATGETVFLVDKLRRRLHVYRGGSRVATFVAELGAKGLRQKLHSGDQATPEGRYRVTQLRDTGRTTFYKALMIDYPNEQDRARYALGRRTGQVPRRAGIGSLIEIHGEGGQGRDWTDGCVALSNSDMDRVFALARVGTPVTIVGTY